MARKITKQQQSRIAKHKQKHVTKATQDSLQIDDSNLGPQQEGLLIAHYGVFVDIEAENGLVYRCNVRQNLGTVVPGDRVIWQTTTEQSGILVAILPRKTLLARAVSHDKIKPLAANLDQVIIVTAPQPRLAINLLDSYLVAIEILKLSAIILCNKQDLIDSQADPELIQQLNVYRKIGYPVLLASALHGEGFTELMTCLRGQTSIFVGQSGVGKSSLISRLIPETHMRDAFSAAGTHSTHTTTTARLYHLPAGGDLIDSPGVRDFVLWNAPIDQITENFIEFRPYLGQCQFRNCTHLTEPQCAVRNAVEQGIISPQRYNSYHRIIIRG